jgi:preprotein translocase subunit SecF|tara:strand:- start:153 stop:1052 length:900 start_codon:yes stop_codon:yes gene_type:complete
MFGLNKIIPVEPNINFLRLRRNFLIISSIAIIASIVLLFFKGLNLGIDFKGGTLIEVSTKNTSIGELRDILSVSFNDVSLQEFGNENIILIRLQNKNNQESIETINNVKDIIQDKVVEFRRSEFVGPTISSELLYRGFQAVSFALIAILIYIWLRFEWQFGFGAVVALTHDVIFTLGLLSILNVEFSLATIAAILTIAGYSINDTVVIFDRVRENLRKYKKLELVDLFNLSVNNTLSRTVMTSLTTLLALFSLFIFGGEVIRPFALTMIIGVIIGTYSSVFIAVPTLLIFKFRPQDDDD